LDTMRVMKLIAETSYARGIELLEGIVAMLTKMTWKIHVQGGVHVPVQVHVNVKVKGTVLSDRHCS